jgi:circadian clock protein KaiB
MRNKSGSEPKSSTPQVRQKAVWELRLYVAGPTPRCLVALANLKQMCEQYLPGMYHIEVIDLLENPKLSRGHQILAIPTLVRTLPVPMRTVVGDLSNTERVVASLGLPALANGP